LEEKLRRELKVPDVVSRLKGYVNIMGPNPLNGDTLRDPFFLIRRAILLNSIISRGAPQLVSRTADGAELQIDPGVRRALLRISRYHHGARSMEAIVATSQLSGKRLFERSCLPAPEQLNLHLDGQELQWLMRQPTFETDRLE